MWTRIATSLLLGTMLCLSSLHAQAGIDLGLGLLKKKSKPDAVARAKALITTLQTDPDQKKRQSAAEELRGFDPRTIPEVIPALVNSLQRDPIPAVRIEAVESISRLKPISQTAGLAMESALQTDPDNKVRDAVRAALFQYQINGYRTPPTGAAPGSQSSEPPLAKGGVVKGKTPSSGGTGESFRPIVNSVGQGGIFSQSNEPPLAKPKAPAPPKSEPKPLPSTKPEATAPPAPTRGVPQQMPSALPTPTPVSSTPLPIPAPIPTVPVPTTPLPEIKIPTGPTLPAPPSIPVPSGPGSPKN